MGQRIVGAIERVRSGRRHRALIILRNDAYRLLAARRIRAARGLCRSRIHVAARRYVLIYQAIIVPVDAVPQLTAIRVGRGDRKREGRTGRCRRRRRRRWAYWAYLSLAR